VHLKSKPVVDLIVAGLGAGFIPFLAGWNTFSPSLPFPTVLGLAFLLAQAGAHTMHIASDREADSLVGLNTSAVRFGGGTVSKCGFIFFLSALMLFITSVSKQEIPPFVTVISVVVLPVATPTIFRYIAVIRGGADKPGDFAEMRRAIVHLQVCFLAAYALAFLVMSLGRPNN